MAITCCTLRIVGTVLLLAGLPAAAAERGEHELGLRYWYSTGETSWNHDARSPLFGNPTSVLSYEGMRAHSLELYFRRALPQQWVVRGFAGLGEVAKGSFQDEDFLAGQVKFSDTMSAVRGGSLRYAVVDAMRTVLPAQETRPEIRLFAGFLHWTERQDAYGLEDAPGFVSGPPLGTNVPVISNEARWNGVRFGVGAFKAAGPYSFSADFALVPYADLRNLDYHYLRADLGPVPNIRMEGSGMGWQLDAEVRRKLAQNLELGVGLRYWMLRADGSITFAGGFPLPLNRLESRRAGLTAALVWKY